IPTLKRESKMAISRGNPNLEVRSNDPEKMRIIESKSVRDCPQHRIIGFDHSGILLLGDCFGFRASIFELHRAVQARFLSLFRISSFGFRISHGAAMARATEAENRFNSLARPESIFG